MATLQKRRAPSTEAILGGDAVVYGTKRGAGALEAAVRDGLPFRSFEAVAKALELGSGELAALIGVAPRTLARRKHGRTLSAVESDRLVGVARIASLAEDVLGSRERARRWLRAPVRALAGKTPFDCLDTDPGRRRVEDVLYAIAYGMIS